MHTVELLEEAQAAAIRLGLLVREDWPENSGLCQLKDKTVLFLDPSLSPLERLSFVLDALHILPGGEPSNYSPALQRLLAKRRSA